MAGTPMAIVHPFHGQRGTGEWIETINADA